MMIASCGEDVIVQAWPKNTDTCSNQFQSRPLRSLYIDVTWNCESTFVAGVPLGGQGIVICPSIFTEGEEPTILSREYINVNAMKCAHFSRIEPEELLIGSKCGTLFNYNIMTKTTVNLLDGLPGSVKRIEVGNGDDYLLVACEQPQVFIVEGARGITESICLPGKEVPSALTTGLRNANVFAAGSQCGILSVWDLCTAQMLLKHTNDNSEVRDVAFSPTDDTLTSIGSDGTIQLFDLRSHSLTEQMRIDMELTCLAISPNGNDLLVGTHKGIILHFDHRNWSVPCRDFQAHYSPVRRIAFQRDTDTVPIESFPQRNIEGISKLPKLKPLDMCLSSDDEYDQAMNSNNKKHGECHKTPNTCNYSEVQAEASTQIYSTQEVGMVEETAEVPGYESVQGEECYHEESYEETTFDIPHGYMLVKQEEFVAMRHDIQAVIDQLFKTVMQNIDAEFLKMRLTMIAKFCETEQRNQQMWARFKKDVMDLAANRNIDISSEFSKIQKETHRIKRRRQRQLKAAQEELNKALQRMPSEAGPSTAQSSHDFTVSEAKSNTKLSVIAQSKTDDQSRSEITSCWSQSVVDEEADRTEAKTESEEAIADHHSDERSLTNLPEISEAIEPYSAASDESYGFNVSHVEY